MYSCDCVCFFQSYNVAVLGEAQIHAGLNKQAENGLHHNLEQNSLLVTECHIYHHLEEYPVILWSHPHLNLIMLDANPLE